LCPARIGRWSIARLDLRFVVRLSTSNTRLVWSPLSRTDSFRRRTIPFAQYTRRFFLFPLPPFSAPTPTLPSHLRLPSFFAPPSSTTHPPLLTTPFLPCLPTFVHPTPPIFVCSSNLSIFTLRLYDALTTLSPFSTPHLASPRLASRPVVVVLLYLTGRLFVLLLHCILRA
jgi:hypothetical protein